MLRVSKRLYLCTVTAILQSFHTLDGVDSFLDVLSVCVLPELIYLIELDSHPYETG